MILLTFSFFATAILYAAVGFGGGSTYNALLVLAQSDFRILPAIALICNLIVVSGGTYQFHRAGYIDIKQIAPWIITSVPAAWLGGYLHVSEVLFVGLLGVSLLLSGLRMLWTAWAKESGRQNTPRRMIHRYRLLAPGIGALLGLLAGLVGIGGGIFLAPVLHLLHWDGARKIAATCSVFILVNSLAGLTGQLMKLGKMQLMGEISSYWMLFPAVLIGGQIGSYWGVKRLNPNTIRLFTALLILYVAGRLLLRWWGMI